MKLDYRNGSRSPWNLAVWDAFMPFFLEREAEQQMRLGSAYIPFPTEGYAHDLFMKRIDRLRRYLNDLEAKELSDGEMETEDQVRVRIANKDKRARDESRNNTRRAEVILNILVLGLTLTIKPFRSIETVS